jgi:hypothetical protein
MSICRWMTFCALFLLAGCGGAPERSPGTGAKEAAQGYFEALLHKDWSKAYNTLHPSSRSRLSGDQFARLAQTFLSGLGFEPDAVQIRAWDERGSEATAHVILTGKGKEKNQRYKDAISLQRIDEGWRIILPQNFGRTSGR